MKFTYRGTAYKQAQDPTSPWMVNFVAPAEAVVSWSGIPRRSEKGLVGFQRPDEPQRVDRAQEYFKDPVNQSPTALILGVHRVAAEADRRVFLNFLDGDDSSKMRQCEITIQFNVDDFDLEAAIIQLKQQIALRLAGC